MPRSDLVAIVEAAYQLEGTPSDWMRRVVEAVHPTISTGFGTVGFRFRLTHDPKRRQSHVTLASAPAEYAKLARALIRGRAADQFVRLYSAPFHLAALSAAVDRADPDPSHEILRRIGARDFLGVKAIDPTGNGVMIATPTPDARRVTRREDARWARVTCHIAAGLRLMSAGPRSADAILDASARVVHARGRARDADARERLRRAAADRDRARSRRTRHDQDQALELWRGLVDGEWSLVDRFERDGRRFVIARANAPQVRDPRALTPLERRVVAYVALGNSNKLIAYSLGMSESSVGMRLSAALAKLGFENRTALASFVSLLGDPTKP